MTEREREKSYSLYRNCEKHQWHVILSVNEFKSGNERTCPQCEIESLQEQLKARPQNTGALIELFEDWYCEKYWNFKTVPNPRVYYNKDSNCYNHLDVDLAYTAFIAGFISGQPYA